MNRNDTYQDHESFLMVVDNMTVLNAERNGEMTVYTDGTLDIEYISERNESRYIYERDTFDRLFQRLHDNLSELKKEFEEDAKITGHVEFSFMSAARDIDAIIKYVKHLVTHPLSEYPSFTRLNDLISTKQFLLPRKEIPLYDQNMRYIPFADYVPEDKYNVYFNEANDEEGKDILFLCNPDNDIQCMLVLLELVERFRIRIRKCEMCGKYFFSNTPSHNKYCTPECAAEGKRMREKEYSRTNIGEARQATYQRIYHSTDLRKIKTSSINLPFDDPMLLEKLQKARTEDNMEKFVKKFHEAVEYAKRLWKKGNLTEDTIISWLESFARVRS